MTRLTDIDRTNQIVIRITITEFWIIVLETLINKYIKQIIRVP